MDVLADGPQPLVADGNAVVDPQHVFCPPLMPADGPHGVVVIDLDADADAGPPQVVEVRFLAVHARLGGQFLKLQADRARKERLTELRHKQPAGVGRIAGRLAIRQDRLQGGHGLGPQGATAGRAGLGAGKVHPTTVQVQGGR